jgi:N-acetylmuramoyl-L-alanine amidase
MGRKMTGRTRLRHTLAIAFSVLPVLATGSAWAQPAPLPSTGVTAAANPALAGDTKRTRFVISLERAVEFQVFSLANPHRVFVDLPDVKFQLPTLSGGATVGLVKSFYGGIAAPGKTRIVIDVTGPVLAEAAIEKAKDGKPTRLVLEIVPVDANKPAAAKKAGLAAPIGGLGASNVPPPAPKSAQRPRTRETAMYRPIIVIDPGHGGHDSGATKFGTVEKDVVLAFSLKLRDKLTATGRYKVLMTRDSDKFVELDARRAFGDTNRAALFIAVHADYAGSGARGATIYSLKDATSKGLQRSAGNDAIENVLSTKELESVKSSSGDPSVVKGILQNLARVEVAANKDRTSQFSKSVIEFMGASTPMMNNPDREANFRVLKSAKTPSVLIELAYVTNQQDAQNLRSDAWREKVTDSLMTAIGNYFTHQVAQLPF